MQINDFPSLFVKSGIHRNPEISNHLDMSFSQTIQQDDPFVPGTAGGTKRRGLKYYWVISLILVGLGISTLWVDTYLMRWFAPGDLHRIPGDLIKVIRLSEVFAHGFGIALIAFVIWRLSPTYKRFVPRIVLCAMLPAMTAKLLKIVVARKRPVSFFDEKWHPHFPKNISESWLGWSSNTESGAIEIVQSFPSAHTATVWGLAIGIGWVFPRVRTLFVGIAILASLQRLVSLSHWPSDVLFGAAIAVLMAGALTHDWGLGSWLGKFENRSIPESDDATNGSGHVSLGGKEAERMAA